MASDNQNREVSNQQFNQTVTLTGVGVNPNHVLVQQYYPLNEADFIRMGRNTSLAYLLGSTLMTLFISDGVEKVSPAIKIILGGGKLTNVDVSFVMWTLIFLIAAVLLIVGVARGGEKRKVLKKIAQHFENNPPIAAYRSGE